MISPLHTVSKAPHGSDNLTRGERLRIARVEAGFVSLPAAAEAMQDEGIDVSHQALGHYERDRTSPQIDLFCEICAVYDASPLWVLVGLGPQQWSELPSWTEAPDLYEIQAAIDRFANGVAKAPPEVREKVAEYWTSKCESLKDAGE